VQAWAAAVVKVGNAKVHAAVNKAIQESSYKGLTGTLSFNERRMIPTSDATQPTRL
jgi:hypothetical protein